MKDFRLDVYDMWRFPNEFKPSFEKSGYKINLSAESLSYCKYKKIRGTDKFVFLLLNDKDKNSYIVRMKDLPPILPL